MVREVAEETGVQVGGRRIRLLTALAVSVLADAGIPRRRAHRTTITLRDGELEDARWFTRADLAAGHPALPPAGAISARLIDGWFHRAAGPPRRW